MKKAFEVFAKDLIDYAGMFPPAKLPFADAYENYLRYRESEYKKILARFILPMDTFAPFCDTLSATPQAANPVRLAVLGGEAHKELTATTEFTLELSNLKMLADAHPNDLRIENYEVKLSIPMMTQLANDPHREEISTRLTDFGEGVVAALADRENDNLRCFFEVPFNGFSVSAPAFEQAIHEFARINERLSEKSINARVGIKLRCGGVRVPASFAVAGVIVNCVEKRVPFKATMGLHHPFFSNSRDERHGFISLFAAGIIAAANPQATKEHILEIVSDGHPEHFVFTEEELIWNNQFQATLELMQDARRDLFISFGSCSFDEPLDDLRALGLI